MRKLWTDDAWAEYLYWQSHEKKIVSRINELLKSIERDGAMKGIGKPEPLKYRNGYSRRITESDRLAYDVENGVLYIYSCKGHYNN